MTGDEPAQLAEEQAWTALIMRSRLDSDIWVPTYGGDKTCYEHPGRLRAVKKHVEQAVRAGRAGMSIADKPHVWHAQDPHTWLYVPSDRPAR